MIIFLILITLPIIGVACNQGDSEGEELSEDDLFLEEVQEGTPHNPKLPPPLTDPTVNRGSGPEVLSAFPPEIDEDADGVVDRALPNRPDFPVDNCPDFYNPEQEDEDGDGVGDACE